MVQQMVEFVVIGAPTLLRCGLISVIEGSGSIRVTGQALNTFEAIQIITELEPDVVLMIASAPCLDYTQDIHSIRTKEFAGSIIIMNPLDVENGWYDSIEMGADGYIHKDLEPEAINHVISSISRGEDIISPATATKWLHEFASPGLPLPTMPENIPTDSLTKQDKTVLEMVSSGHGNSTIAAKLAVSEDFVKKQLRHIVRKSHIMHKNRAAV
jgi:DNA-binding NarL/FixJ family response regulator